MHLRRKLKDDVEMHSGTVAIRCLRYIWSAPCTAVGLCVASPGFLFGAKVRIVDGVIEVALPALGPSGAALRNLPFIAITFGHVVIAISAAELDRLRTHEHEHVRQYEKWGPVFFLAYPLASLWQLLRGGRPYMDNWFEVQARKKEGEETPSA